jgi:hypothetical protein
MFVSLIAFVFSPTKLERKAEQILPGSEGGAMTETMHSHMNK